MFFVVDLVVVEVDEAAADEEEGIEEAEADVKVVVDVIMKRKDSTKEMCRV